MADYKGNHITEWQQFDRWYRLQQQLEMLCDEAEALAKGEDGEQLRAMVLTKQIRRILTECS